MTFQTLPILSHFHVVVLQPRICRNKYGLGSFHFARRYFGNRCFFLFLLLLRCFSSEGWPPLRMLGLLPNGLSHSEIFGSSLVCKSPKLIAAYHVFLRLQEPRHPPYALIYFLLSSSKCLFHLDDAYLISLNMSMNFVESLSYYVQHEIASLAVPNRTCCFNFEEAEQLSLYL